MAKTIIVTGASKGIGLAVVKYLISQSHNVLALARSKDLLERIRDEDPARVRILTGDMGDLSIPQKAVDFVMSEFGQLDGVIINHGTMDPVVRIENCNPEDWARSFNVNLFNAVSFGKAAIPQLRKTQGVIIMTSSGAAAGNYSAWGAYGAAKAAMNHLARQFAAEEPEITSLAVRPGVVATDMQTQLRDVHFAVMDEKDKAKFIGLAERGEMLKPEQPGHVIAKLAIDPPKELNGQFISWDSKELAKYQ